MNFIMFTPSWAGEVSVKVFTLVTLNGYEVQLPLSFYERDILGGALY